MPALLLLLAALTAGPPGIAARTADGESPDRAFLRVGEPARLSLALGPLLACTGDDGADRAAARCRGPAAALRWVEVRAVAGDYDNFAYCGAGAAPDCQAPIEYRDHELTELAGRASFALADAPALASAGTHRIEARIGEITLARFELVLRRDDSYRGLVSELIGVPFVYWPRGLPGHHQTDLRRGADCVALVIYGQRRLDRPIPYVAPSALDRYATEVGRASSTARAGAIEVRTGDILHFGFQTAVLSQDRGRIGRLDDDDRVLHTYHGLAEERRVGDLPYRNHPLRVLRWPAD